MNDTSSPETELILIRITGIDRLGLTEEDIERGNLQSAFSRSVPSDRTPEELEEEMKKAIAEEDYERAARLRDRISELKHLSEESGTTE